MKSINFPILFLILLGTRAVAQPAVSVGKPYDVVDAQGKNYFSRGNEILAVKISGRNIVLQKFNSTDLNFQQIRQYEDFPKGFQLEKLTKVKDRYFVFYSLWDGENEQLFYREIDFKEGNFKGAPELLIRSEGKFSGGGNSGFYGLGSFDKFDFFFSYDSSKMLIQSRRAPEIRKDSKSIDIIVMHVYDDQLKSVWSKEVLMPYTEKKMDNLDYSVDKEANAYIVARVYDDETTDKKNDEGNPNYHIELLTVNAGKELSKTPVEVTDKFLQTIWLYENPKGYMICAGFYNIGKMSNSADGIFLFKLSQDGKVYDVATYEIPVEVLSQYVGARGERKNKKKDEDGKAEFENLDLKKVLIETDGSLILVGEQHYEITYTSYNSTTGSSSSRTTYYYNDMLAAKVAADGKLQWMKKLPKRQVGKAGRGGMSFHYIRGRDQHHFLFLDNENNIDLPMSAVPAAHLDGAGGFLTAYSINNATGLVTKTAILNTREVEGVEIFQFAPHRIVRTSPVEFVFEAYKKKKEDILVKVKIEN
jgi:hypothetical protein